MNVHNVQRVVGVGNPFIDRFIPLPIAAKSGILDITSGRVHVDPDVFCKVWEYIQGAYPEHASRIVSRIGGGALRTLQLLHAEGMPVRYYGATGNDEAGRIISQQLEESGIPHGIQRYEGATAAIAYIDYHLGIEQHMYDVLCAPGASHDLRFAAPADAWHFYIEGYLGASTGVWRVLSHVLQETDHYVLSGTIMMVDIGSTAAADRIAALCQAYNQYQVLLIISGTEDEIAGLLTVASWEILISKGIILIEKQAERGAVVHSREGSWHHRSLAENISGFNTVGAGDAFSGGFLKCMLEAYPQSRRSPDKLQEALELGSAYAANHIVTAGLADLSIP